MVQIAHGWALDVERGPGWLFVRPHGASADPLELNYPDTADATDLADDIWTLVEQNFTNRVVLELDRIGHLNSYLIGQLMRLYKRISSQGGLLRLCGLSATNQAALDMCKLSARLPAYANRTDAVMASRPVQPR